MSNVFRKRLIIYNPLQAMYGDLDAISQAIR